MGSLIDIAQWPERTTPSNSSRRKSQDGSEGHGEWAEAAVVLREISGGNKEGVINVRTLRR